MKINHSRSPADGGGTCSYTTNSLNQYTAAGTASYQYDASGNMTHDNNYAYGYDPENRLTKVVKPGSAPALTLEPEHEQACPFRPTLPVDPGRACSWMFYAEQEILYFAANENGGNRPCLEGAVWRQDHWVRAVIDPGEQQESAFRREVTGDRLLVPCRDRRLFP